MRIPVRRLRKSADIKAFVGQTALFAKFQRRECQITEWGAATTSGAGGDAGVSVPDHDIGGITTFFDPFGLNGGAGGLGIGAHPHQIGDRALCSTGADVGIVADLTRLAVVVPPTSP